MKKKLVLALAAAAFCLVAAVILFSRRDLT